MKKCLFLMMAVAAFATGFTLCSCGGNSSAQNPLTTGASSLCEFMAGRVLMVEDSGGTFMFYARTAAANTRLQGEYCFQKGGGAMYPGLADISNVNFSTETQIGTFDATFRISDEAAFTDEAFLRLVGMQDCHDVGLVGTDKTITIRFIINEHTNNDWSTGTVVPALFTLSGLLNDNFSTPVERECTIGGSATIVNQEMFEEYTTDNNNNE